MIENPDSVNQLIGLIYAIILLYFLLGGIGFFVINRKKRPDEARKSYVKFITYFLIINILFFSIYYWPWFFHILSLAIIGMGFFELIRLFVRSSYRFVEYFILSMFIFTLLSGGFYLYSFSEKNLVLYAFLIISIFDSFSQISGQLWGRKKILPKVSPNKTVGGVLGGAIIAVISSFLLGGLYEMPIVERAILTVGIVIFGFIGDALASMYKRKFGVKDFSQLIPGHGGFLDRFDSFIAGGAWVAMYLYIL